MKLNFSWRWTVLFAAIMNFIGVLLTGLLLPESPKWLFETKQYKKCIESVRSLAEENNVRTFMPSQDSYEVLEQQDQELEESNSNGKVKKNGSSTTRMSEQSALGLIMKDSKTFINMFAMIMVWVSASFCYYLISYQLKYLRGDLFVNGITSSVSEIAAFLLSGIFLSYLGLKSTLIISYVIAFSGMFCLLVS